MLGVVHKLRHGFRGRGQLFYDDRTKTLVIKRVTIGKGGGAKNSPKLRNIFGRPFTDVAQWRRWTSSGWDAHHPWCHFHESLFQIRRVRRRWRRRSGNDALFALNKRVNLRLFFVRCFRTSYYLLSFFWHCFVLLN